MNILPADISGYVTGVDRSPGSTLAQARILGMSGGTAAVGIYAADFYDTQTDTPLLADIMQWLPAARQQMSASIVCLLFNRREQDGGTCVIDRYLSAKQ